MSLLLSILNVVFIILGILLVGLILLRRGEGAGGLGGAFGGPSSEAVFGVKAAKTLDKLIAGMALAFLLLGTLMHTKLLRPAGFAQFKREQPAGKPALQPEKKDEPKKKPPGQNK